MLIAVWICVQNNTRPKANTALQILRVCWSKMEETGDFSSLNGEKKHFGSSESTVEHSISDVNTSLAFK